MAVMSDKLMINNDDDAGFQLSTVHTTGLENTIRFY